MSRAEYGIDVVADGPPSRLDLKIDRLVMLLVEERLDQLIEDRQIPEGLLP